MANRHDVKVKNWHGATKPTEAEWRQTLQAEGLSPYRWSNDPGDFYSTHTHTYHKVLVVVSGTIIFGMPEVGRKVRLNAGDRMELPAHIGHNAVVGVKGVRINAVMWLLSDASSFTNGATLTVDGGFTAQ